MRLYVIQIGSAMLINNQRCIKIGYYQHHTNDTKTKYYLAAAEEDNFEVSATQVSHLDDHESLVTSTDSL